jgi:hypothetical protein
LLEAQKKLIDLGYFTENDFEGVEYMWCQWLSTDNLWNGAKGMVTSPDTIIFDRDYRHSTDVELAPLLAHEMTHVQQYRDKGEFMFRCQYMEQAWHYRDLTWIQIPKLVQDCRNSFERSAYELGGQVKLDIFTNRHLDDSYEENDDIGNAWKISEGQHKNLFVRNLRLINKKDGSPSKNRCGDVYPVQNDSDWFKFTAEPGKKAVVEVLFEQASGNIDIELIDSADQKQLSNSYTDNERIEYKNVSGALEVVFLRVFIKEGFSNTYTLDLSFEDIVADNEGLTGATTETVELEEGSQQCAAFDPNADSQVSIPCVDTGGHVFKAGLYQPVPAKLKFELVADSLVEIQVTPSENCSLFVAAENKLHFPCLVAGEVTYWVDLKLVNFNPIQFELMDFGIK